jgi:hypothetical protein
MPRWVAYFGYLVALTLLVAAGEHKWFQLPFRAWVLLVSVVILSSGLKPPRQQGVVGSASARGQPDEVNRVFTVGAASPPSIATRVDSGPGTRPANGSSTEDSGLFT